MPTDPIRRRTPRSLRARMGAIGVLAVFVLGACGEEGPAERAETEDAPAVVGCDPRLADYPHHVAFAKQNGQVAVYANPGDPAPTQSFDAPRLTDSDPPLEVPLSFLVTEEPEADDCKWMKVMLPIRPNGSTGWVKREDVRVEGHVYRIDVSLSGFNLKAYKGDELILDAPIGVAVDERPTPPGRYYTTELLQSSDPAYGPYAFGLSGFSDKLTTFNSGQGQLGLHGTDQPERVGTKVSSGCIRLKNEDIETLVTELEDTPQGVPVQVSA